MNLRKVITVLQLVSHPETKFFIVFFLWTDVQTEYWNLYIWIEKNAKSFRNRSSQKLHIEAETVPGYSGQASVWCSNEWGPGDFISFLNLHMDYEGCL